MEKYTIYMHTTPSGKVYIGQTSKEDPNERWLNGNGYKDIRLFYPEIKKYGWDNIEHKILHTNLSWVQADILEKLYICFFQEKNISLNIANKISNKARALPTEEIMTIKRRFFDQVIKQFDINPKEEIKKPFEDVVSVEPDEKMSESTKENKENLKLIFNTMEEKITFLSLIRTLQSDNENLMKCILECQKQIFDLEKQLFAQRNQNVKLQQKIIDYDSAFFSLELKGKLDQAEVDHIKKINSPDRLGGDGAAD